MGKAFLFVGIILGIILLTVFLSIAQMLIEHGRNMRRRKEVKNK